MKQPLTALIETGPRSEGSSDRPKRLRMPGMLMAGVLLSWTTWGIGGAAAVASPHALRPASTVLVSTGDQQHRRSDERRLVWVRYDPVRGSAGLVVGDVEGSKQRQLTRPARGVRDSEPVRSPDGTQVLFNREFPDGTGAHRPGDAEGRNGPFHRHRMHRPLLHRSGSGLVTGRADA